MMENIYNVYYETSLGELRLIIDQDKRVSRFEIKKDNEILYSGNFECYNTKNEKEFLENFIDDIKYQYIFDIEYLNELRRINVNKHFDFSLFNIKHEETFRLEKLDLLINYKDKYYGDKFKRSHSYNIDIIIKDKDGNQMLNLPLLLGTSGGYNIPNTYIGDIYRYTLPQILFNSVEKIISNVHNMNIENAMGLNQFLLGVNYRAKDNEDVNKLYRTYLNTIKKIKENPELYENTFKELVPEVVSLINQELNEKNSYKRQYWR